MNPILLKPSSDVGSQVIVNGEVRARCRRRLLQNERALIPEILSAYNSLAETVDIIVIEGAGSPAEINLKADDIVNMGLARLVDAPFCWRETSTGAVCLPSCTARWRCWSRRSAPASKGLLINKFRGDVEILRPGLAMLEENATAGAGGRALPEGGH